MRLLVAQQCAYELSDDAIPRPSATMRKALLEAVVFLVADRSIGTQRRRVVRAHIEHDVVARAQELLGDGARRGLRVAATAEVVMSHDIADGSHAGLTADDVRACRRHEPATAADAVVHAVCMDSLGSQPAKPRP